MDKINDISVSVICGGVMTPVTLLHHIICMCSTMTGLCRDNHDNLVMALYIKSS